MDRTEELKKVLQTVVDHLIEDGSNPQEVNNGLCADFATVVWEYFDYDKNLKFEDMYDKCGCGHTWLSYMGVHYDAEAVDGVADPRQLPFFIRDPDLYIEGVMC